jgi:hypothetical protein
MAITIICRVCGRRVTTTDLRRVLCDSEECRNTKPTINGVRNYEIACEWCGGDIPKGSHRRTYCCEECSAFGIKRREREWGRNNRDLINHRKRMRYNRVVKTK